jgi:hypothetical protein
MVKERGGGGGRERQVKCTGTSRMIMDEVNRAHAFAL